MDNIGRLWHQVAAEAGVSSNKAKLAVYVMGLADQGKTLAYIAAQIHRKPEVVKKLSREFIIDFPDYRPFAAYEKRGEPRPGPRYTLSVTT